MPEPTTYPTAPCTTCRNPMIWATTARDKTIPVDATPSPDGNIRLDDRGPGRAPLAVIVAAGQADMFGSDERRWTSHFVTCPQADAHRRDPQ